MFNSEAEFEAALIKKLTDECGWDKKILRNCSEKDLIKNWADILFQNNRQIDRLNDYPLTEGEMGQILEQISQDPCEAERLHQRRQHHNQTR